jgi:CHAT domain-containing protein
MSLGNLGLIYYKLGNFDKFETMISDYLKIRTSQVENNFTFLSNRQREFFWEKEKNNFKISYPFAYYHPTSSMTALVYDNTLFTKGLMLRTANEIRDVIYTSGNADLITNFEQLGSIRQQISTLQTQATPDLNWISTLESRADSLDKALTIASSEYREFKEDLTVGWSDIQKHLNPNEVAIEFVNFKLFNKQLASTDSVMYCAMLIRQDSGEPEFLPLFEQSQLLELLKNENTVTSNQVSKLYNGGNPRFFNGQKLYNLIWEPLEKHLEGIETVYYSPSGLLNRISFAAIPVDSLCLIDKYNLQLLSSTREIVHKSKKQEEFLPLLHAVIYGGIAYDIEDATQLISLAEKYKTSETEHFASRSIPNDSTRSAGWSYLQGTETEVNEIEKLLQQSNIHITKYMGAEANEESFKNLSGKSPELLHIATHGFFLENEKKILENPFMQMISENSSSRSVNNPLLRSGLLFAGANRAWTNKEVIAGIEDGILTAEEIANLNLTRTKLVVLSACKTALGDVDNSEGVFGLQRSFKLAGVETLVMSLWDVSDRVTCQFMLTFYQNLLDGKTKLESFQIAQKQIRGQYKNPYYWAAFVMMD